MPPLLPCKLLGGRHVAVATFGGHTGSMSVGRSTESLVGSELAGYRIEALIGRGGMGAVYRAQEAGLERKVALKVIAPELAQDAHFRDRFLRESQIAASLDHPHVIPILKAGEEDGLLFLAMRYVEGTDLAKLLAEEGALEPRRAVQHPRTGRRGARRCTRAGPRPPRRQALERPHRLGRGQGALLPRRLRSHQAHGLPLRGDRGRRRSSAPWSTSPPSRSPATPWTTRSDVYSLGCVLYECLTGQSPFPRATDVALLWAHVHEEPTPPSKARPELPRELDTVLARALAKEPGRRYRSAGRARPGDALRARHRRDGAH